MQNMNEEQCLRAMKCELNVLSRSDGSAMFTQGSIIVLYGFKHDHTNACISCRLRLILLAKCKVI
jgi:ribonuclease PH